MSKYSRGYGKMRNCLEYWTGEETGKKKSKVILIAYNYNYILTAYILTAIKGS